jgi:hypothetical protein
MGENHIIKIILDLMLNIKQKQMGTIENIDV